MKRKVFLLFVVVIVTLITITAVLADDGYLVRKSMSHGGQQTTDYPPEAEHAFIGMMKFYVPTQAANGTVGPIEYKNVDDVVVEERDHAKPLIGVYIYGPYVEVEGTGFVGHGRRDAWGAVSLDDGETWKKTNLSQSADKASSSVKRPDIELFSDIKQEKYPGDVVNIFHAIAGNKVLVAWPSRFCSGGEPAYSLDTEEATDEQIARREAIAAKLGIDLAVASEDDLYLIDMYSVAGQQGSVDYAEDKFEQNHDVGEVPYSCLWTARGVLVDGDDPRTSEAEETYMRWFKPERLTSGARDVNRIETKCVSGAGCAITWQEDPDGLRPGQGEGPGEGWSGAIANHQTDVWYSYIPWSEFDVVQDPSDDTGILYMTFDDYTEVALDTTTTQKPKPFVPFAMPMRMTDNAKCNVDNPKPYCNGSAITADLPDDYPVPMEYGLKNTCADIIEIEADQICVTEDGLPLVGNTATTRPRLGLYGYDSNGLVADAVIDSAFVVVVAEESKGLGAFGFTDTGAPCDPETDDNCTPFDEGKNILYHSFSMSLADSLAGTAPDGLPANLTNHGSQLNQPQVNWETGEFYEVRNTSDMWGFGEYDYDIYDTEIARRGSLLAQDIYKVHNDTSGATGGLIALPAWKQGVMKQGGPADVMARRIHIPNNGDWNVSQDGNPYAFRYMDCANKVFEDGSNPYYPQGLCLEPAINLSGTIPDLCTDSVNGGDVECPIIDLDGDTTFATSLTNPILQGNDVEPNTTKILAWHQCPSSFTTVSGETEDCDSDLRPDDSTLADQSWYNPLEVAKGHRGFLDGDFVMILYAWSPNWRLNKVGHDRYELYIRRSFDGAQSWTTQPSTGSHWDGLPFSGAGTVTCETYRSAESGSDQEEPRVCNSYPAGAGEQARNITQLKSMRTTTLDPRYAISGSPQGVSVTDNPFESTYTLTEEDTRDPSRYFIAYETGDNTTTAEGEPEPLDLFYSRAVMFGDHYQVWAEEDDLSECYPSDPHENEVPADLIGSGFCNEFDQLDQGTPDLEASESSLTANPGGQFLYGVWTQVAHDTGESDAMARRIWWLDDYISDTDAWVFGGGSGSGGDSGSSGDPVSRVGGPYTGVADEAITFDGSASYDAEGLPIVEYEWDFGDGTTGAGMVTEHIYTTDGTFDVSLVITNDAGSSDISATTVTVEPAPILDLDITRFKVTRSTRVNRRVVIKLTVKNTGAFDDEALATVVGVQNGIEVYNQSQMVSDSLKRGAKRFSFPVYRSEAKGVIDWTVTIFDGDPDVDMATAITKVR